MCIYIYIHTKYKTNIISIFINIKQNTHTHTYMYIYIHKINKKQRKTLKDGEREAGQLANLGLPLREVSAGEFLAFLYIYVSDLEL